jgi:release factor glutamine methyltransferase
MRTAEVRALTSAPATGRPATDPAATDRSATGGDELGVGALVDELRSVVGDPVEARWIAGHAFGLPVTELVARASEPVGEPGLSSARAMAARRAAGEPLQHVLGTWAFRSLEVQVDGRALIPRPETEQVAGFALDEVHRLAGLRRAPLVAVDLGTGSGVIALSLAVEGPSDMGVWATERSAPALELARANLELVAASDPSAAGRVQLMSGSWFEPLPPRLRGAVDVVVANPPYVSARQWHSLDPVVRDYDPPEALVPGPSGLEALLAIVEEARRWLTPSGALVLELAPGQAQTMLDASAGLGYAGVGVRRDLAGLDRVLVAQCPAP